MPRLDGFEVLCWVRRQPRLKHLPVIIFSASEQSKDVQRAHDLGANSFVLKPHSIQELNGLIGRFKKHWLEEPRVPGF
jgi:CheY-like chemotaxis protein